mmetsp:Transcript_37010/g.44762  ORF Transcript_37010/g.44762 Transcript_37010/m.44762 type:complete len:218 (+) Transcript_37010:1629-2282(+)
MLLTSPLLRQQLSLLHSLLDFQGRLNRALQDFPLKPQLGSLLQCPLPLRDHPLSSTPLNQRQFHLQSPTCTPLAQPHIILWLQHLWHLNHQHLHPIIPQRSLIECTIINPLHISLKHHHLSNNSHLHLSPTQFHLAPLVQSARRPLVLVLCPCHLKGLKEVGLQTNVWAHHLMCPKLKVDITWRLSLTLVTQLQRGWPQLLIIHILRLLKSSTTTSP